jgi:exodeoxyribonuclease V alpha subunit
MNEVLLQISDAFEARPQRPRDETWLPNGFTRILGAITEYTDVNEATLWAATLLLSVMERGGSCLPLELIATLNETMRLPGELRNLTVEEWKGLLKGDAYGDGEKLVRPLVVHDGRLYFDRYLRLEREIVRRLLLPLGQGATAEPSSWTMIIDEVFGVEENSKLQREAALNLFKTRVAVLAGGPGTGKTFTVAKILVALHRSTGGRATVKLCAPTGKAAQRIKESLSKAVEELDPSIAAEIIEGLQPTTIHKLLRITPLSARRHRSNPLHVDFVICDETSMVDLVLLNELLRSISEDTRILLVGDPNQLQSVDVGSVMTDLVEATKSGLPGTTLDYVHRVLDDENASTSSRAVMLEFFSHIRHDRIPEALAILERGDDALKHVAFSDSDEMGEGVENVTRTVVTRAKQLIAFGERATERSDWTPALDSTMVLAAQHRGPLSRTWWVEKISELIGFREGAVPAFVGLPVLVTSTDRSNGVTNGDTGLIIRDIDGRPVYIPSTVQTSAVSDDVMAGALPPTAIHNWQPWYAMTIHKSQGSEFDNVIVSITPGTRLLSKELLYTAVTRAKKTVTILGTSEDIEKALRSPAKRYSGLKEIFQEISSINREV